MTSIQVVPWSEVRKIAVGYCFGLSQPASSSWFLLLFGIGETNWSQGMAFQIVWFPDKTKTTLCKFYCIVDYATVGLYLQQTFRDFSLQENEMVCVELVAKDKVFNQ